jgi:hypothetical protein
MVERTQWAKEPSRPLGSVCWSQETRWQSLLYFWRGGRKGGVGERQVGAGIRLLVEGNHFIWAGRFRATLAGGLLGNNRRRGSLHFLRLLGRRRGTCGTLKPLREGFLGGLLRAVLATKSSGLLLPALQVGRNEIVIADLRLDSDQEGLGKGRPGCRGSAEG